MKFINTRPIDRAEALSSALQQRGHHVLNLPLLSLQPLALNTQLIEQYTALTSVDAVVVVSPIAVEIGLAYYQKLGFLLEDLAKIQWIAVGQATQHALMQMGLNSVVPEVETSEGMLSLPELNQYIGKKIAFWRGIGGRTFMMEQLQMQGTEIVNMLLYTRGMPDTSKHHVQQKLSQGDIVLISSEASWKNWLKLLALTTYSAHFFKYIVLGERVSAILQQAEQVYYTVYKLSVDEIHQRILQCKHDE